MERFLQRHASRLVGSISGFDRVLFRGTLLSISYVQGLDYFMGSQRVGFKDFRGFVEKFSAGVKARAQQIAQRAGRPFLYVASGQASKEALVRELLERQPIPEGLVCVVVCGALPDVHGAARPGEPSIAVSGARGQVFAPVLLYRRPGLWVDAHPPSDLAAADHSSVYERAGVAGAADAAHRHHVRTKRQLLHPDCRPGAGARVDGSLRGVTLGPMAEPLGAPGQSLVGGGGTR